MSAPNPVNIDAYAPKEIAARVETAGVAKAGQALLPLVALSVLAGVFIAFGAMYYTVTVTGSELGFGPTRMLGALAFSVGLILVVVGGAELFTGNSLIVMAWAAGKVTLAALMRNWVVVFFGNAVGAIGAALAMHWSGALTIGGGAAGETALAIAAGKLALDPMQAFFRGVLCNALVCLAVWLCFAAHTVSGKILAIVFPVSAFVAIGFEHSIANLYLIPVAMLHGGVWDIAGFAENILYVTTGNIIGGGVFVALSYWVIYLRTPKA
ncbi:MAG: formate/nitrite transporter family protein [Alphaproteobacteria bacterium]